MMLLGERTGTYGCGSTGIVSVALVELGFPKMPYAVSVAAVVPVIVTPAAPFAGYWYGAGAMSITTPRAFSVVHARTTFVEAPQPRGGSAVKDVMTGVPGSTTW